MNNYLQQTVHDDAVSHVTHTGEREDQHHIHLPAPSYWPLILGLGVMIAFCALLFLPDSLWFMLVAGAFIIYGIMGWALEDPMAAPKDQFVTVPARGAPASPFIIGQDVVDSGGQHIGSIGARFKNYVLVERGAFSLSAFYVPVNLIEETNDRNVVRLTVSEKKLADMHANEVPDDLFETPAEDGPMVVRGVPQFARGPLSPAETGHYNYGPNSPGINTDAANSYTPDDIRPNPRRYVADRRKMYATAPIPPRSISPD